MQWREARSKEREVMMKAVCFKEVLPGDVVCQEAGKLRTVGALSENRNPYIELFMEEGGFIQAVPDELIALAHRPWPKGTTEQDVLRDIDAAITDLWLGRVTASAGRAVLRNFLEIHELGKPVKKSDEPSRNESLVDHHMMP